MKEEGQIKRCQGLDELGRHAVATSNPHNVFISIAFDRTIVLFRNEIWLPEKT